MPVADRIKAVQGFNCSAAGLERPGLPPNLVIILYGCLLYSLFQRAARPINFHCAAEFEG
jgi:hypothetical protein